MKESNSAMIKLGTAVNIITAVMFTLFTAYQIFLLIHIDAQRNGRLTGIILYLFLTAASFFALVHKPGIKFARSVLLIAGLLLLFGIRLINVPVIFGNLDFANTPSVLRCAVYVFSQLGTIALAIYYLLLRHNKRINSKRIRMVLLMSFVIVLYVSVLIMEYVLILKYRVNIDLSVKYTMLSRLLYCFGFVGMAVSFMLPIKGYSPSVKRMNQVSDEDAFVFSAPKKDKPHSDKDKKRNLVSDEDDFVFSAPKKDKPHSDKDKKRNPVSDEDDFVFSAPKKDKPHSDKDKKRNPVLDDADIVFSTTINRGSRSKKSKRKNR